MTARDDNSFYTRAQLESYAAARVAEATADQSSALEALNENEKDIAVAQAVEFAQYVVDHAKGRMVEAAERFLALPYSQDVARRMAQNCDELQRRVAELEQKYSNANQRAAYWKQRAKSAEGHLDGVDTDAAHSISSNGCVDSSAPSPGDALSLHGAAGRSASRAPADVEALLRSTNSVRKDFTVEEALMIADRNDTAHRHVPSVSRTLASEVRSLYAKAAVKDCLTTADVGALADESGKRYNNGAYWYFNRQALHDFARRLSGAQQVALPEIDAFLDLRKLGIHNMVYATRFKCRDGQNALYSAEKLKSYAAARVAEATEELRRNFDAAYAEVMRIAPWSESNDMEPVDELLCGIGLLAQDRDKLQRRVAELEANDRRYRWLCTRARMDPDMGGNHRWHSIYLRGDVRGPTLEVAIDAILTDREGGKA